MRIIDWNCSMAFRKKANLLLKLDADILVIQECEHPDKLNIADLTDYPHKVWIGTNHNKGLLVAAKEGYPLNQLANYSEDYKYALPIRVGSNNPFYLIAIWAQTDKVNWQNRYIGQVRHALDAYQELLTQNCVIVGDFNSNAIWDNEHSKALNHSAVVQILRDKGIESLYHHLTKEAQGEEKQKTLFFRKNLNLSYHIDHCFVSDSLLKNSKLKIPGNHSWLTHSDHLPLIIDLEFPFWK